MKTSTALFFSLFILSACGTQTYDIEHNAALEQQEMRVKGKSNKDSDSKRGKESPKEQQRKTQGGEEFSGFDSGCKGEGESMDMCGTCDSDPTNDCVQDDCGVWGGTTQTQDCNECQGHRARAFCYGCIELFECCSPDGEHAQDVACWSTYYNLPDGNFCQDLSTQFDVDNSGACAIDTGDNR